MPRILPLDDRSIAIAAEQIRAGRLVAFPTETVYGLGGDATNDLAVAAIFEAKGRPRFNPLIVHLHDIDTARSFGRFDERAEALAARFWPGPLTLVVPRPPDGRWPPPAPTAPARSARRPRSMSRKSWATPWR